jgi:hypothetical protein
MNLPAIIASEFMRRFDKSEPQRRLRARWAGLPTGRAALFLLGYGLLGSLKAPTFFQLAGRRKIRQPFAGQISCLRIGTHEPSGTESLARIRIGQGKGVAVE